MLENARSVLENARKMLDATKIGDNSRRSRFGGDLSFFSEFEVFFSLRRSEKLVNCSKKLDIGNLSSIDRALIEH